MWPITFPYTFPVSYPYRRDYLVEVRDSSGNLVRFINSILQSSVRDILNAPSILRLSIPASDAGASVTGGMNEIWIRDQADNIHGKYRIVERVDLSSANTEVSLTALSYLSQLGEEWILGMHETSTALSDIISTILGQQQNENPITVGTIESAVGTTLHEIDVDSPQTMLKILQDLEADLPFYSRFWVDEDRQLQWIKINDQTHTGRQFRVNRNLKSLSRSTRYDRQVTRLYAYGSERKGKPLRLGDREPTRFGGVITLTGERQRWRFYAVAALTDEITIRNVEANHEDPRTISGYDNNSAGVRTGDEIQVVQNNGRILKREITFISVGGSTTILSFREAINVSRDLGAFPRTIHIARNFIDSPLRGAIFKKMIVINHNAAPKDGSNLVLALNEAADADIAAYVADQANLTIFFLANDNITVLSDTVSVTNWTTGAYSGNVTIPNPSVAFDSVIYLVLAWSVY